MPLRLTPFISERIEPTAPVDRETNGELELIDTSSSDIHHTISEAAEAMLASAESERARGDWRDGLRRTAGLLALLFDAPFCHASSDAMQRVA